MKKANINSKKGFTIIEVVLVLAIAGLIFLMVFVALPNLQRTQRDTQRRDDVARLSTSLTQYITNNNKLPDAITTAITVDNTTTNTFAKNYLLAGGDTFEDPSGSPYKLDIKAAEANKTNQAISGAGQNAGGITVITGAQCGTVEGTYTTKSGSRNFAVIAKLEGAGSYCSDNN